MPEKMLDLLKLRRAYTKFDFSPDILIAGESKFPGL